MNFPLRLPVPRVDGNGDRVALVSIRQWTGDRKFEFMVSFRDEDVESFSVQCDNDVKSADEAKHEAIKYLMQLSA
ncbi:MAG: hypothetical protein V4675_09995 [Verrucomicrobiota bacterium]